MRLQYDFRGLGLSGAGDPCHGKAYAVKSSLSTADWQKTAEDGRQEKCICGRRCG